LGFQQYTVKNNQRPDEVALDAYGDMKLDWVVLLCNNIINLYDEWPMSEDELERYIDSEYEEDADSVHHWVTQEVKDMKGRVLLKAGREVPENFTYRRLDGTYLPKDTVIRPISVYDHETEKNDYKRNIYLLRKTYLTGFIQEFKNLCKYLPNVETDPETQSKKSLDTVEEQFVTTKPTYSTNIGQTSSIDFASESDYSSRTFDTNGETISEGDVLADGTTVVTTSTAGITSASDPINQYGSA